MTWNASEQLRPLPAPLPDLDRRSVLRVPPQPYARVDTNDYSLDPTCVGRRVELHVSSREVAAVALDTGELVARHLRTFARYRTITAPAHARILSERRAAPPLVEVRALARYDALIPG